MIKMRCSMIILSILSNKLEIIMIIIMIPGSLKVNVIILIILYKKFKRTPRDNC